MNTEHVQQLIDEGLTKYEIAEVVGVMPRTLELFLKSNEMHVITTESAAKEQEWVSGTEEEGEAQEVEEKKKTLSNRPQNTRRIQLDEERVVSMYVNQVLTLETIARYFKVGKLKIRAVLLENGVVLRGRTPTSIKATPTEMKAMYNDGMTREEIAEKYKVTVQAVNLFMSKHKITLEKRTGRPKKNYKSRDKELFYRLLSEHKDMKEVAKHYGVSYSSAYHYLHKWGLAELYKELRNEKGESNV